MKKVLTLLSLVLCMASVCHAAYFTTLFQDPAHPKVALSSLYTSKFAFDGAESDVAVVFHKADPKESIIPQKLLDAGVKPVSWTLIEVGAGGNAKSGFGSFGPGVYVAQTLLGPIVQLLSAAGGNYKTFGELLVAPDGSGIRIGVHWKANLLDNGGVVRFDDMRFAPRYVFGYGYQF